MVFFFFRTMHQKTESSFYSSSSPSLSKSAFSSTSVSFASAAVVSFSAMSPVPVRDEREVDMAWSRLFVHRRRYRSPYR